MWLWQSPRRAARRANASSASGACSVESLQPAQVVGLLAGERLGDAAGRDVADPAQAAQLAGRSERCQLVRFATAKGGGGTAEGPDAVGGLVAALQQERDAAQVGHRVARVAHGRDRAMRVSGATGP